MKPFILDLLNKEVKPAMGCTEPVAVALASAKAAQAGGHRDIKRIEIVVSPNFYKNGLSVGIPHSPEVGLDVAGALGACGGDSELGLKVLESITESAASEALALVKAGLVEVKVKDTDAKVYIEARVCSDSGTSVAVIEHMHNHFVLVKHDDHVIFEDTTQKDERADDEPEFFSMPVKAIIDEVESMTLDDLDFLLEGIDMNRKVADIGLAEKKGIGVGYTVFQNIKKGVLSDDLPNRAMYMTAAASDARMSGVTLPVMSSNGSGNNGLTAILPLVAYSMGKAVEPERMAKALAISHLINCYIKYRIGRLSALCSCAISAATGSGAAITWLEGGDIDAIKGTIQNMVGNLSGMICDGAKNGCALKLATAASSGVHASILAMNGVSIESRDGIVGRTAEESIRNLGIVGGQGMQLTDHVILDVMKGMEKKACTSPEDEAMEGLAPEYCI